MSRPLPSAPGTKAFSRKAIFYRTSTDNKWIGREARRTELIAAKLRLQGARPLLLKTNCAFSWKRMEICFGNFMLFYSGVVNICPKLSTYFNLSAYFNLSKSERSLCQPASSVVPRPCLRRLRYHFALTGFPSDPWSQRLIVTDKITNNWREQNCVCFVFQLGLLIRRKGKLESHHRSCRDTEGNEFVAEC